MPDEIVQSASRADPFQLGHSILKSGKRIITSLERHRIGHGLVV
jgi:hypothetical protein